jgi:hypothetical protein
MAASPETKVFVPLYPAQSLRRKKAPSRLAGWRHARLLLLTAYLPPKVKFTPAKYLKLF